MVCVETARKVCMGDDVDLAGCVGAEGQVSRRGWLTGDRLRKLMYAAARFV